MGNQPNAIMCIFTIVKELAHKIVSISLALLLLASTTSWKVEKHFCMGHLIDIAFFSPAQDCGMTMNMDSNESMIPENSCCSEEIIIIDGQDDLKLSINDIDLEQQLFLIAFTNSYIDLFIGLKEQVVPNEHHLPPPLVKDIHVLDQVFLI